GDASARDLEGEPERERGRHEDPGCGDRVRDLRLPRGEVGEAREGIVLLTEEREEQGALDRGPGGTGLPVAVGHRGHGEDLGVGRGHEPGEAHPAVPGGYDVREAGARGAADRLVQWIVVTVPTAAVVAAGPAEAQVDRLDAQRGR